jgi:hypothetical protein
MGATQSGVGGDETPEELAAMLDHALVKKRVLLRGGNFDDNVGRQGLSGMVATVLSVDCNTCTCVQSILSNWCFPKPPNSIVRQHSTP